MKEIRLCVERRRAGNRNGEPFCSDWVHDTPDARGELTVICDAGNIRWGSSTHWIEERARPVINIAGITRKLGLVGARASDR